MTLARSRGVACRSKDPVNNSTCMLACCVSRLGRQTSDVSWRSSERPRHPLSCHGQPCLRAWLRTLRGAALLFSRMQEQRILLMSQATGGKFPQKPWQCRQNGDGSYLNQRICSAKGEDTKCPPACSNDRAVKIRRVWHCKGQQLTSGQGRDSRIPRKQIWVHDKREPQKVRQNRGSSNIGAAGSGAGTAVMRCGTRHLDHPAPRTKVHGMVSPCPGSETAAFG